MMSRLDSWVQGPAEKLDVSAINSKHLLPLTSTGEIWVRTPTNLQELFGIHDIPWQTRDGGDYSRLNAANVSDWLKSLITLLRRLHEFLVYKEIKRGSLYYHFFNATSSLYCYLYELHEVLDAILKLPSLVALLNDMRTKAELMGLTHGSDVVSPEGKFAYQHPHVYLMTWSSLKQNSRILRRSLPRSQRKV
jgi:hypothetical protein